jgi:hypothetical protein
LPATGSPGFASKSGSLIRKTAIGDLALQVVALEVVPAALGGGDAIAHEDQRGGAKLDARRGAQAGDHHVLGLRDRAGLAAGGEGELRVRLHLGADQRHGLGPAAVVAGRLQAQRLELGDQVVDHLLLARAAGRAAGELGGGEHAHVLRQALGRDRAGRVGLGGGGGGERRGGDEGKEAAHGRFP